MSKQLKKFMSEAVRADLDGSPDLLVIGLATMDAQANFLLRRNLREKGVRLRVIHNRVTRQTLGQERKGLAPLLTGQTAIAVASEAEVDFIPIAKTLLEAERYKRVQVRGGFVDGELLDREGVTALANSPDKPTLRAMLLAGMLAPGRGIATSMNAVLAGLARCIQERVDKGGAESVA